METRFVARDLRTLDTLSADIIACPFWSDVRPMRGLAGLVDWRLAGKLGELLRRRFVTGSAGELLLVPISGELPFGKLIVFGVGARAEFNEAAFARSMRRFADSVRNLKARSVVIELPGRADSLIGAGEALEWMGRYTDSDEGHAVWSVVEDSAPTRSR